MNGMKFCIGDVVRFCDDTKTRSIIRSVGRESLLDIDLTISECRYDEYIANNAYKVLEDELCFNYPESYFVLSGTVSDFTCSSDALDEFLAGFSKEVV